VISSYSFVLITDMLHINSQSNTCQNKQNEFIIYTAGPELVQHKMKNGLGG